MTDRKRIIVVLGPTAGGKTALGLAIAQRFGGEIVSADSMQVYRGLDAGTAKPNDAERNAAVHHLIDCVDPTQRFTVADWLGRTEALIADMHARGVVPVVVGGTNLYLKALLEGMFEGPPTDDDFRGSLDGIDAPQLHERLRTIDPEAFARIAPNDRKRIIRALEVHHATGKPITELQREWSDTPDREYRHDPILIGLRWSVEAINRRINARVKTMFDAGGLIEETRRLSDAGQLGTQAAEAIGTKQVLEHLAGRCTEDEARERVKIDTRRYAKSQRTWLRRYRGVHWIEPETMDEPAVIDAAIGIVENELRG